MKSLLKYLQKLNFSERYPNKKSDTSYISLKKTVSSINYYLTIRKTYKGYVITTAWFTSRVGTRTSYEAKTLKRVKEIINQDIPEEKQNDKL